MFGFLRMMRFYREHRWTHRHLSEYLDGELNSWKRAAIARHLDKCPPCAQGFDFEIELRQVIAFKCRDDVPPQLRRRIAIAIGVELPPEEPPVV